MTGQQMIETAELGDRKHAFIRFRESIWADPNDYMRLSVFKQPDGSRGLGPWLHLYARRTQEATGEPTPQEMMIIGGAFNRTAFLTGEYETWTGPLDITDR